MMRHLEQRKEQLLKTVVREYIHTAAPVASLMLGGHHGLEASSATLRNWMGELELLGLLKQPHSSSGRVPTDLGYRHYVDLLMERGDLTPKEKRTLRRELESGYREIEDLLREAAEIISDIGRCAAVILPPLPHDPVFKSLQLVPVDEERILAVLVTTDGLVLDRLFHMNAERERLPALAKMLNERLSGRSLSQIGPHLLVGIADEMMAELYAKISNLIAETIAEQNKNRMMVEGTHHLLEQPEFRNVEKFRNTLEAFKQENRISRFLGRVGAKSNVNITIGFENPLKDFQEFSVIAAPYKAAPGRFGTLALVGPTRMDYDHLIPLIEYAASILTNRLCERVA